MDGYGSPRHATLHFSVLVSYVIKDRDLSFFLRVLVVLFFSEQVEVEFFPSD